MDWGAHLRAGTSEYRFVAACMLVELCACNTGIVSIYQPSRVYAHIRADTQFFIFIHIYIHTGL